MSYDIGYHAISKADIEQAEAYILGQQETLSILPAMKVARKARFIANGWGLGVKRLASRPANFDSDLHLWGRPFFITDDKQLNSRIKQYLTATPEQAEQLVEHEINHLQSDLAKQVSRGYDEVDLASWDDESLEEEVMGLLPTMKKAFAAYQSKATMIVLSDETYSLIEVLQDLPFQIISSVCHKQPTWMSRGYVWPSLLLSKVGAPTDFFHPASELIPGLSTALPNIEFLSGTTIDGNYEIGGMVAPDALPRFKATLESYREKLIAYAIDENWYETECPLVLKKLAECIDYCMENNCCFVESSDIYSGPMGLVS